MALNIDAIKRNSDCGGDSYHCHPRNYHAEVSRERDDRTLVELECENCGAEGVLVINTEFGSHGDVLANHGDFESEGR